jgi:spore germination cell wall hydrolase CwlJ-like protein
MYHEARGDGMIGMLAVTNVVFNRLKTRGWPSSICKVVYQPGQFSWTSQPALPIKERQIYAKTYSLAIDILRYRRQSFDITNGALYFHAITLRKKIKTSDTIRIGNHLFYKTRQFGEV